MKQCFTKAWWRLASDHWLFRNLHFASKTQSSRTDPSIFYTFSSFSLPKEEIFSLKQNQETFRLNVWAQSYSNLNFEVTIRENGHLQLNYAQWPLAGSLSIICKENGFWLSRFARSLIVSLLVVKNNFWGEKIAFL